MRNAWKILAVACGLFLTIGTALAGVPKVVFVEDYTATW
jgi:hypothetical protein